jgi:hypothetical protein
VELYIKGYVFVVRNVGMNQKPINGNGLCICCSKPKDVIYCLGVEDTLRFEKHHITYFPQQIAYVHHSCHKLIHDGQYPHLIQYNKGDSRKFWKEGKRKD